MLPFHVNNENMTEDSVKRLNSFQESLITKQDNLIQENIFDAIDFR